MSTTPGTPKENTNASTKNADVDVAVSEVWYLKPIMFAGKHTRIITQNFNGPCSFIAICNILILRGNLEILPPGRTTVSYELLSQLVAEYLLRISPDVDISAALSIMPYTLKGMDLNPVFVDAHGFRPQMRRDLGGGEGLELFSHANIPLVHGWLVDPLSPEYEAVQRAGDYDASVNVVAEADHFTQGRLVVDENEAEGSSSGAGSSSHTGKQNDIWTTEERMKVEDAISIRQFLNATQSQLTYHGLFHLASALSPNTLSALFRGSHLSVLYKSVPTKRHPNPILYTLVTDQSFLNEPSVVWEKFGDVDGQSAEFVDSYFIKSAPVGGDYAGETGESTLAAIEAQIAGIHLSGSPDERLARRLQMEEDSKAREIYRRRQRALVEKQQRKAWAEAEKLQKKQKKKEKDCVIM
ncbi:hypothetical protein BDM02DRAFT_3141330 [Thelephora ganbajun]|uniref:Uncharacterized protein n=1 Tax=Thelephora ganbajun TaxID=370292 RepID=A0ACB6ZKS4_THEGA|nr:hypothetical protein BDM02DRAFT_3141330 [Thelephora ganbajun]